MQMGHKTICQRVESKRNASLANAGVGKWQRRSGCRMAATSVYFISGHISFPLHAKNVPRARERNDVLNHTSPVDFSQ